MTRGAALGAFGLAPSVVRQFLSAARVPTLTRSTFEPLVGDVFGVDFGGTFERVTLAEVNGLASARSSRDEDRFALVFRTPLGPRRPDGIHVVAHPRIGEAPVYLSAVDRGVKALNYEAVFFGA
jgi:hypothetical protein